MKMINVESKIYLKVLSPVHIGGAQEKHLQEGLDYFDNWRINEKEVYHPERGINPDELAEALASGNRNKLAALIKNQNDWKRFVTKIDGLRGTSGEIKSFIKSGTDGKAYIPGSSIKGAMRSAIANFLGRGINNENPDHLFIKDFDNSLFRFVKIADCPIDQVRLFKSKLATLGESKQRDIVKWSLKWKEKKNFNAERFSPDGFDTLFESPDVQSLAVFDLKIAQPFYSTFEKYLSGIHPESGKFLSTKDISTVFLSAINHFSLKYLDKEISWFKRYPGDQSERIISELGKIKRISAGEDVFLFHLGSGSGFHAMTGDWQFAQHADLGLWTDQDARKFGLSYMQRMEYVGKKEKFKTRRIAFNQWPNPSYFGPMGYVLLSQSPFHESENKSILVEKVDDIVKPPVEIKPVHRKVAIKSGVILDGVVKENKMVDVYLPDGTIKSVKLVSGIADIDKVIEVTLYPDGKGNFFQASFKGFKKEG